MQIYHLQDQHIVVTAWQSGVPIPAQTVWIDLLMPTKEQEAAVEQHLGMAIPTREEMGEIEVSNRLYEEDAAQFMTATMMSKVDTGSPETHAVTFILAPGALVTVRYVDTTSFRRFAAQVLKQPRPQPDESTLLLELLDTIVNRIADILERIDRDINRITKDIFRHREPGDRSAITDYQQVLERIGRCGDLVSKAHESLVTLDRVTAYSTHNKKMAEAEKATPLLSIRKDISGLSDHGTYLTGKVNFLLDATLGMISIQQNGVFRVLSVASLVFMPPTLVAGIYGMNFQWMPELNWQWGYPIAVVLMVMAAILPYVFLKQRRLL